MMRHLGLGLASIMALGMAAACTGPEGPAGKDGADGSGDPSVSAVTPAHAYLGRTVDLTIAGSGTKWTSATKVAFSDDKIKVNSVTAASDTGLKVNVTVLTTATIGTTDITVSDTGGTETYKGAFDVRSPLAITVDPVDGVPQGGFAFVTAKMLDIETPYDASDITVDLTGAANLAGDPSVNGDYSMSFSIYADILAVPGEVDVSVDSGVSSPAAKAFKVVPRAPKALTVDVASTGTLQTSADSGLYQYTPADTSLRFVQVTLSSADGGGPVAYVVPKSGKLGEAVGAVYSSWGTGVSSTDPYYFVVTDGGGFFSNPPPYGYTLKVTGTKVTAATEITETTATNNDDPSKAQSIATLPALVDGRLGYGSDDGTGDLDVYKINVTGAPKKIHAVTGGDGQTDALIEIFDCSDPTKPVSIDTSSDADYQEELTVTASKDGDYCVVVSASTSGYYEPAHNGYQLFIELK